jgi:hypothetical protein
MAPASGEVEPCTDKAPVVCLPRSGWQGPNTEGAPQSGRPFFFVSLAVDQLPAPVASAVRVMQHGAEVASGRVPHVEDGSAVPAEGHVLLVEVNPPVNSLAESHGHCSSLHPAPRLRGRFSLTRKTVAAFKQDSKC